MYTKSTFKRIRHMLCETLASTDSTTVNRASLNSTTLCGLSTTTILGCNFDVTIKATTGAIYIIPDSLTVPTSSNSWKVSEGNTIDIRVPTYIGIRGDSTTAKFQAIVWGID